MLIIGIKSIIRYIFDKRHIYEDYQDVIYVEWEYSESGWGVEHDGCSLHLKKEDVKAFENQYWETMPKDHVPEGYARPGIYIKPFMVKVSDELYSRILNSKYGIMMLANEEFEAKKKGDLVLKWEIPK